MNTSALQHSSAPTAVSSDILKRFAQLPTANVADAMDRLGVLDSRIKPVWSGATIAGHGR